MAKNFYLLTAVKIDGDHEYIQKMVKKTTKPLIESQAQEIVHEQYTFGDHVQVKLKGIEEITETEYAVLEKYL
jgi:hypothetical protein